MRQRELGNTGLTVSEIGMGTWELGGREWGDIGETDAVDLLRYAFESGVTYYDTADQYGGGRAERLTGRGFFSTRRQGHHCYKTRLRIGLRRLD